MTLTRSQLRESMSRFLGDWLSFDTTTNITTNNYIISTSLAPYRDDEFNDTRYVLITEGNNITVKRLVKDFAQFENRLEVYGAALAAETGAVTCELHRFDPDDLNNALNKAVFSCYPYLSVPRFLPNQHFEYWGSSSYPDYWRVSEVTAVKEGTTKHNGTYSAKVTRAGTDGYLYTSTSLGSSVLGSELYNKLLDIKGTHVKFPVWVYATSASQARLCIYCGSSPNIWYSPYHSGGSSWELIEIEADIPSSVGEVGFRCEVNTTDGSVYFDGAGQPEAATIDGLGYLASLSADTDALELTEAQGEALACKAAALFLRKFARPVSASDVSRYKQDALELELEADGLLRKNCVYIPQSKAKFGWQGDLS